MVPPRERLHSHVADGYDVALAVRPLSLSNLGGRVNVLRLQIPRDLRARFACANNKVEVQLERRRKRKEAESCAELMFNVEYLGNVVVGRARPANNEARLPEGFIKKWPDCVAVVSSAEI